jgi:formate-dependent nitrite reductase membrane component NrfD
MMNFETHVPHWEWYYIAMYFYIGGVSAGAYSVAALAELFGGQKQREVARIGFTVAFWVILATPVLLIADLGRPERFWHLFFYSKDGAPYVNWLSPLSVGSWALLVYGGFSLLSYLDILVSEGRLKSGPLAKIIKLIPRKIYAVIGAAVGLFVAGYTGVILNITARPLWAATDPLLGSLFIASGASTGAAAIALVMVRRNIASGTAFERLQNFDRVAMIFELGLIVLMVLVAGRYAAPLLFTGYGFLFWVGTVLLGILVPLQLHRSGRLPGVAVANPVMVSAVLVLVGGALLRICLVQAGQM